MLKRKCNERHEFNNNEIKNIESVMGEMNGLLKKSYPSELFLTSYLPVLKKENKKPPRLTHDTPNTIVLFTKSQIKN